MYVYYSDYTRGGGSRLEPRGLHVGRFWAIFYSKINTNVRVIGFGSLACVVAVQIEEPFGINNLNIERAYLNFNLPKS